MVENQDNINMLCRRTHDHIDPKGLYFFGGAVRCIAFHILSMGVSNDKGEAEVSRILHPNPATDVPCHFSLDSFLKQNEANRFVVRYTPHSSGVSNAYFVIKTEVSCG